MIDNNDTWRLHILWNIRAFLIYVRNGFIKIIHQNKGIFTLILYCVSNMIIWLLRFEIWSPRYIDDNIEKTGISVKLGIGIVLLTAIILFFIGKPKGAKRTNDNLHRMGLVNHAGEAPLLLSCKTNQDITVMEFESFGIALSNWQDKKENIQSALNIRIDMIEEGSNSRRVLIFCVSGNRQLPTMIVWDNRLLSQQEFELVLGESYTGQVKVDLSLDPHLLIGGSTGSGKSQLLKLLLKQCILKGAKVFVADFKGGVDFNRSWKDHAKIVTEPDELSKCLDELVEELHRRKRLLVDSDCANIDEYNRRYHQQMPRMIIGCDEVAELLDKTGLGKNDREQIQRYEAALATLVRLGRAMGIHCILATQRPDAQVISGQIKNNIDFRVCGRADDVLSQIILDKTDANDLISKTAQGRFLTNTDVLFQAYYFDDKKEW